MVGVFGREVKKKKISNRVLGKIKRLPRSKKLQGKKSSRKKSNRESFKVRGR